MSRSNITRHYLTDLTILNVLAQTLNETLDLRSMLDGALAHIIELMGLRSGWIFLVGDAKTFMLAARHDLPPAISYPGKVWEGDCTCQDVCLEGKCDRSGNMVHCSRLRGAVGDKRGLAQHASLPLYSSDELLGILNVATTAWAEFSPSEWLMLSTAASMLGMAMARAQLYEKVKVRRVQEQGALLRLSEELLLAETLEPALQRLVRVAARLLDAHACAFVEADEEDMRAVLRATYGWNIPDGCAWPLTLDATTPHLWYLPEHTTNLPAEALAELPALLKQQGFLGHRGVFVEVGGVPVGTLMVNTRVAHAFVDDDAQLLGLLANQLAQTLERERLNQEALERQRLEQELDFARDIQESFLPDGCPSMPGYAVAAYYRAARHVGGDFYDFMDLSGTSDQAYHMARHGAFEMRQVAGDSLAHVCLSDPAAQHADDIAPHLTRLGVVIADVTDKGVPAALFMALSRTLLRATASDGRDPAAVFERVNHLMLSDARAGLFVTCFYAQLDLASGMLTFANGGHNYPLLYHVETDHIEQLRTQGIVLGILPQARFEQRVAQLQPGDVLLLYTDGITEAMNGQRELFGEERLIEVLCDHSRSTPQQIIDAVLQSVHTFVGGQSQSDDMTMVVIQRLD